jgi:prepilin peptidase CpaA
MMAVGSLVGWQNWLLIFIVTGIIGGVIALLLVLFRGRLRNTLSNVGFLIHRLMHFQAPYMGREELDVGSSKAVRLPHGAVIALGTLGYLTVGYFVAKT